MSHLKEREEKICLNCNAAIYGRFCHVCGQENIEPRESFWHLSTHFIADLLHFDGKFFSTLKKLLFKPGYLAHEHLRGRRADYLHPIRLYIFVSAFFFLIVFAFYTKKHITNESKQEKSYVELINEFNKFKKEKQQEILEKKAGKNSAFTTSIHKDSLDIIDTDSAINLLTADTTKKEIAELIFSDGIKEWQSGYWKKHRTKETYLDSQNKLPVDKRDGYFERKEELVEIAIDEKAREEHISRNQALVDLLLHNLPKGLFVGLPVYAFILFIIYSRNKRFTYVSHVIFSIHLFCFTFLMILLRLWLFSLLEMLHIKQNGYIGLAFFIVCMLYTYKGLRNFYEQRRAKTIAKFFILSFACILVAIVVISAALSISALTM